MADYEDIDLGFNALFGELAKTNGSVVETGLMDPEEALKGIFAEYGTSKAKARPWLSIAADTAPPVIEREAATKLREFGPRSSSMVMLEAIGKATEVHTRDVIVGQTVGGPELKQSTIDRKGHATKLIDSGDMLEAITHEVHMHPSGGK